MLEDRTDVSWHRAAKAWLKAKEAAEKAALILEKKRWALMKLAGEASASGEGVSVTRYFRAGTIQYGQIAALQSVDLDAYRKSGTWEVRVTKQ